ncbi:hypothetical protein [Mycolicibacterium sp. SCSIO 43805]|uniref:hypothetical protein n=1 Tax=Mycolicibacterium sp. SCSIO 43805 TaxID=3378074 RepID=UPI003AB16B2F
MGVKTATRRLLSRRVSVAGMVEVGLWLAIPYLLVGLVFAFFGIEQVRHIESLVSPVLPAGGKMAGYLVVAGLWPAFLLLPGVCGV